MTELDRRAWFRYAAAWSAPALIAPGLRAAAAAAIPELAGSEVRPLFPKARPTRRFTAAFVRDAGLSLHEAEYWRSLDATTVQCELCPSACTLAEGQQGRCRARVNIDGTLRSIVYARPVTIHDDPVEKKPLYHVLPGSRALSLATVGCNLGCVFCQNHEISQATPEDVPAQVVEPERLVELAVQRRSAGIAYTYTEPTVFFEYMEAIATRAKAQGLRNYWISCGQIEPAPLSALCEWMDAANIDLKGYSDEFYVRYCHGRLAPVLRTLTTLRRRGVYVEITNLIIPEANDRPEQIRAMCRWIVDELGAETVLHFSRFQPAYRLTRRPATPVETLERARDIARDVGLRFVYVGNVRLEGGGDTVCPGCGEVVLSRDGFYVSRNRVINGRCGSCDRALPGIWTP